MNPFEIPLQKLAMIITALKPVIIHEMGNEAVNFVDDNFRKQGFQGETFTPWPKRRSKDKGAARALLVQTGTLRRSIRQIDSEDHTTIGTDIIYAKIHNEGGNIRHPYRAVTLNFRGKPGALKLGKTGTETQQRKITTQRRSSVYNHVTNMPKRQFIGPSPVLNHRCEKVIIKLITNAIPK